MDIRFVSVSWLLWIILQWTEECRYFFKILISFLQTYLFLIGGYLFYNIVLDSAIHQHESSMGIHMFPPSRTSIPPPTPSHPSRLSQSTSFEFPASYSKFPLVVYFTYGNVDVSVLLFQFAPPSPSLMCPHFYSLDLRLYAALWIALSVPSFSIICVNMWYSFFSFWLTSFHIIGSRFIHLIKCVLFMAE